MVGWDVDVVGALMTVDVFNDIADEDSDKDVVVELEIEFPLVNDLILLSLSSFFIRSSFSLASCCILVNLLSCCFFLSSRLCSYSLFNFSSSRRSASSLSCLRRCLSSLVGVTGLLPSTDVTDDVLVTVTERDGLSLKLFDKKWDMKSEQSVVFKSP